MLVLNLRDDRVMDKIESLNDIYLKLFGQKRICVACGETFYCIGRCEKDFGDRTQQIDLCMCKRCLVGQLRKDKRAYINKRLRCYTFFSEDRK